MEAIPILTAITEQSLQAVGLDGKWKRCHRLRVKRGPLFAGGSDFPPREFGYFEKIAFLCIKHQEYPASIREEGDANRV